MISALPGCGAVSETEKVTSSLGRCVTTDKTPEGRASTLSQEKGPETDRLNYYLFPCSPQVSKRLLSSTLGDAKMN